MTDHPRPPDEGNQGPYGQTGPYGQPTPPPYGQAPYGQPPHGQGPYGQGPYGQSPYGNQPGGPGQQPVRETPSSATLALVLGIIGLGSVVIACGIGLILSPFAWVIGGRAVREIDNSHGRLGGRDHARAGQVMGIVGTVLLVLVVLVIVTLVAFVVLGSTSTYEYSTTYSDI